MAGSTPESRDSQPPTPAESRTTMRARLARVLRRAMDRCDVSQAALADSVGTKAQKVSLWLDPKTQQSPGLADLTLFPREVARELMVWIGAAHHLTVSDDLNLDEAVDHRRHLSRLVRETAAVAATYTAALEDDHITPEERRDLIVKLRASIATETALLRELEGDESAHTHGVVRRISGR
jgi:hypothetical protein